MKKNRIFWIAVCLLFPLFTQAQISTGSIMNNGLTRDYTLYVPTNYTGTTAVPLILNFHGFGGSGNQQHGLANFMPIADTAGFIVVSPTGTPLGGLLNHWNVGGWTNTSTVDDVNFTSSLIDSIAANYNVDLTRVYATGFSNGGFFSHRLACELGYRIAAIASVAGTFTPEIQTNCNPPHPTPVMQIHGTTDPTVPYPGTTGNGGMASVDTVLDYWVTHNNCNPTPTVTQLPDVNTTDGSTVERIVYGGGDAGVTVEHLKVTNGAHSWPGATGNMDITASLEIWKFFSKYSNQAVGVKTITKNQLKVYPNPAQNSLAIDLTDQKTAVYALFSITGRKIESGKFSSLNNHLDISELYPGIYFLQIENQTIKLIKE